MFNQRFYAAERFGQREYLHRFQQPERRGLAALNAEREGASVSAHLALRQFVLRMRGQAGVQHRLDLRVSLQPARHAERIALVLLHAYGEGLHAAQHQVAILRPRARTHRVLQEADLLRQMRIAHYDCAAHYVRVPVDVLGGGVDDYIHAELEGALEIRGEERVVADRDRAILMRQHGYRGQIDKIHQRIGGRLDPHRLRSGGERGFYGSQVAQVHVHGFDADLAEHRFQQTVRAAV